MEQYEAYFKRADLDGDGQISGAEAVRFFQGSGLSKKVLAQIWSLVDRSRNGYLVRLDFYNALRLITVAQSKRDLTPAIVNAALNSPAAAKIPAPKINLSSIPEGKPNVIGTTPLQVSPVSSIPEGKPNLIGTTPLQVSPVSSIPGGKPNLIGTTPLQVSPVSSIPEGKPNVIGTTPLQVSPVSSIPEGKPNLIGTTPLQMSPVSSIPEGKPNVIGTTPLQVTLVSSIPEGKRNEIGTTPLQVSPVSSTGPLNLGIRPKPQQNQLMRPAQSMLPQPSAGQGPSAGTVPCPDVSSLGKASYDGYAGTTRGYSSGFGGVSLASSCTVSTPQTHNVWKPLVEPGNGIASSLEFVDDLFSLTSVQRKQESTQSCFSNSSPTVSASLGDQYSPLPCVLNPFQSISSTSMLLAGNQVQQSRPVTINPPNGMRPLVPAPVPKHGGEMANQQRPQAPGLYNPFADHLCGGNSSSSQLQEAAEEEKVGETQNTVVGSREKLEHYRTKMQDIMLYKSRCEKRLNEITERVSADKREAETLAKKYEEKCKQLVELESKLTIEEVRFHETEGRKLELRQAIISTEQGGSADGLLQVKADRIQSDLEELMKVFSERCKKNGLDVKSKALVEPPPGWKLGTQEGAVLGDKKWDKFEDAGFSNEITFKTLKQQKSSPQKENGTSDHHLKNEYETGHKEDESVGNDSPAAAESESESHRFFDDLNWASGFDVNHVVDSIWGFNPSKSQDDNLYGSSCDVGVSLGRSDCPCSDSVAQRKNPFAFDDSVPRNTPMSRLETFPPWFSEESSARNDDAGFSTAQNERLLSRLDSISSSNDFCGEKLSRLDSMNSTKDLGGNHGYSFDVADPFGSSGPFTVSSDDKSPKKTSDSWNPF